MTLAGYSGTPLVKKLGIKQGFKLFPKDAPEEYLDWVSPLPEGVTILLRAGIQMDAVHYFVSKKRDLEKALPNLMKGIRQDGMIWISWHKKASGIPTDVTEDVVREVALPIGLVDVKVCAVSEVWSGLKLVIRKELRGKE